ncbi:hypothetical protein, partial [Streptomyces sp. NPDC059909]|uniref:hypothetical protein n=1 Tax=Streptomyces sp. NPDC059909 TaxID=3346998 RepID=UPI003653214B
DQSGAGHRGEQVDLGAVGATGAAHGLAVHGQRVTGLPGSVLTGSRAAGVAGSEPGADCRVEGIAVHALQDPAHRGLGRSGGTGRFATRAAESGEYGG